MSFFCFFVLVFFSYAVHKHFYAYVQQQRKRHVRDYRFDYAKMFHQCVYTQPACHGHKCLKETEHARNQSVLAKAHFRFVKSVCHAYGAGVHCKPDAQRKAGQN